MGESINFEDLFNWQLDSDRHYLTMLHRHAEQEYEWQLLEEQERNKRLPALIQVQLILVHLMSVHIMLIYLM